MRIETVGIVGAGTMGGGIAINLAQHGFRVLLADARPEAAAAAVTAAAAFYARAVEKGRMAAGRRRVRRSLGSPWPTGLAGLAGADLVIEAVFEDFALKARLLEELSPLLRADALVATNTSCLRVGDLARHIARPERFLGLHYFSPAAVNPIVEVVRAPPPRLRRSRRRWPSAGPAASSRCAAGIPTASPSIGSSAPTPTRRRARSTRGWGRPGEIDAVAREVLGAAAGPFAVMNLIKPRINLHAIRNLAPLGRLLRPGRGDGRGRRGRPAVRDRRRRTAGAARAASARSPTGCCAAASCRCCRRSTRAWPSRRRSTGVRARR